jgi:hypothetical protein
MSHFLLHLCPLVTKILDFIEMLGNKLLAINSEEQKISCLIFFSGVSINKILAVDSFLINKLHENFEK